MSKARQKIERLRAALSHREGDRVPADALLISADGVRVDESLLTGEAVPVGKRVAVNRSGRLSNTAAICRYTLPRFDVSVASTCLVMLHPLL